MKKQCKRKSLINDKVAGLAFIYSELLEHCGNAMVGNLTEIFTVVWDFEITWWMVIRGYRQTTWKGSPTVFDNWSGITLLIIT